MVVLCSVCWFCQGQWQVCKLSKFIFNWRIIALQYCTGFYQTSVWISYSAADSTSVCPILSEGKHWWNRPLCIGTQSSTSTVVVTLHCKPPAPGQRTRTQKDPPRPLWSQLSILGAALPTSSCCPAWLAHPTRQREDLGTFTASTECVPSELGKWSGYCLKGYFRKGRRGILGLLMKSGPRWYCWQQACSVSWSISSCVRGLCQVSASNLSFKTTTIRKLGPSKP